jgi:hypothetical protein
MHYWPCLTCGLSFQVKLRRQRTRGMPTTEKVENAVIVSVRASTFNTEWDMAIPHRFWSDPPCYLFSELSTKQVCVYVASFIVILTYAAQDPVCHVIDIHTNTHLLGIQFNNNNFVIFCNRIPITNRKKKFCQWSNSVDCSSLGEISTDCMCHLFEAVSPLDFLQ